MCTCNDDVTHYLRSKAEGDQHGEEEDGPERRDGQPGHHLRVHDKRQAST